ncbi:hypothetical protein BTVI_07763 [Pitangus sulphuratus]|nr:hypothetical protein BTVI_07763 [Pitangus sulphuratus]
MTFPSRASHGATLEGKDAIQRDGDRLERWACVNLVKVYKAKCKILHIGQGNPKHKHRLSREWTDIRPREKDLGLYVDAEFNTAQQHVLASPESQLCPGLHQKNDLGNRSREVVFLLYSGLVRLPLECFIQLYGHRSVGASPDKAMEMTRGLEHLSFEERLRELGLFSLEK